MGDKKNGFSMIGNAAAGAGLGIGSGLIGGLISNQFNKAAEKRQHERTKELNQQLYDLSMKKWFETNYPAQVEQMKKAGLNVGLMYQQGGQGGQSTATGMAGGAGMAPNMDFGGNPMDMALKMKMTEAQTNLMDAQAEDHRAQAEATGGYKKDTAIAQIGLIAEQTTNERAKARILEIEGDTKEIEKYILDSTKDFNIEEVQTKLKMMNEDLEAMERRNYIDEKTKEDIIRYRTEATIGAILTNALTRENIDLTKAKTGLTAAQTDQTRRATELMDTQEKAMIQDISNGIVNTWVNKQKHFNEENKLDHQKNIDKIRVELQKRGLRNDEINTVIKSIDVLTSIN